MVSLTVRLRIVETYCFFRAPGKKRNAAGQSPIQQTLAKPKMQHIRC